MVRFAQEHLMLLDADTERHELAGCPVWDLCSACWCSRRPGGLTGCWLVSVPRSCSGGLAGPGGTAGRIRRRTPRPRGR